MDRFGRSLRHLLDVQMRFTGRNCQNGSQKLARNEQVRLHQKSVVHDKDPYCTHCAPIMRYFSSASDDATAVHQIQNRTFSSIL